MTIVLKHIIYIYIYIVAFYLFIFIIILCRFFFINVIKVCNPFSKLDLPTLARVAEKNERNGTNKKSDTR